MGGFEKLGGSKELTVKQAEDQVKNQFNIVHEKGLENNRRARRNDLRATFGLKLKEIPEEMGTGVADAVKTLENVRSEQRERERMAEKEKTPLWPDA
ncbi:MAG: hypothetical protein AAB798_02640 [Patescibacteria group bacterium]